MLILILTTQFNAFLSLWHLASNKKKKEKKKKKRPQADQRVMSGAKHIAMCPLGEAESN